MNAPAAIPHQVRLPLPVAFEVVAQGVRIRFGRSLVTMFGVALGVAFLMSILTTALIKRGVGEEIRLRGETTRMLGFIAAETGPLENRPIAVLPNPPANEVESRLLDALRRAGANLDARPADAAATLVVGDPAASPDWAAIFAGVDQPIVASLDPLPGLPPNARPLVLARESRPEELAARAADARRERARTIWIVSIALLVTIMGISNALLMSVTERFREIGTMKCLGALSQFIRQIFLIESALVGGVGSALGTLVGCLFAVFVYSISFGPGRVFASLPWMELAGAAVICFLGGVACAVLAALYPANVAARMVPATALRSNV